MIHIITQNAGPARQASDLGPLLTAAEVAAVFRVHPRTPAQWVRAGRLTSVRTPGGHHRYRESDVRALLAEDAQALNDETPNQQAPIDSFAVCPLFRDSDVLRDGGLQVPEGVSA